MPYCDSLTRHYIVLLSWILLPILTISFAHGQGLSVSPSRILFKGEPGETVTQAITFVNNSKNEFNFTSGIKDWDRDSTGTKRYFPVGQIKDSNGKWIQLSAGSFGLKPGETKEVNLSLVIPKNDTSKRLTHSMVFFTQVKEQMKKKPNQAEVGVNVLIEVGVQVYHMPVGLPAGDLEFLAFVDKGISGNSKTGIRKMAVKVKNSGQINKDAYVRFELTNKDTGEEIPIKSIAIAMLPGAEQWVNLDLPANLKGNYLAVAILDAGSQYDLKVAEKEVTY
ncbi:hypothetical protein [Pedobacter panaciterrae]|uniref:P pilus assembly chaperone PapD n=1 Tax=Pedobacter panaciterrae TaxID=363849 RepID=A0ABU8NKN8_9SPHI|nr:hypothetical protein [uncultured Pedobacter sp.]